MKKPFFSVVVPAYNEENFIALCLESLLEQNFPKDKFEIIVVDNGSTDKTKEVVKKYPVRLVEEKKKGVAFARQRGSLVARGEVVVSFDADSTAPKNWLKRIKENFEKNPRAVGVGGLYSVPDYRLGSFFYVETLIRGLDLLFSKVFGYPFHISAANFAFKKEAFLRSGGYPLVTVRGADQHLFLKRLKREGPVVFDPRLMVATSARRVNGRFLKAMLVEGLIYTWLAPLYFRLRGKHFTGEVPDIREI